MVLSHFSYFTIGMSNKCSRLSLDISAYLSFSYHIFVSLHVSHSIATCAKCFVGGRFARACKLYKRQQINIGYDS